MTAIWRDIRKFPRHEYFVFLHNDRKKKAVCLGVMYLDLYSDKARSIWYKLWEQTLNQDFYREKLNLQISSGFLCTCILVHHSSGPGTYAFLDF